MTMFRQAHAGLSDTVPDYLGPPLQEELRFDPSLRTAWQMTHPAGVDVTRPETPLDLSAADASPAHFGVPAKGWSPARRSCREQHGTSSEFEELNSLSR